MYTHSYTHSHIHYQKTGWSGEVRGGSDSGGATMRSGGKEQREGSRRETN